MARPKSQADSRKKRINVLVACEGETESNYIKHVIKKYLKNKKATHIVIETSMLKDANKIQNYMKKSCKKIDYLYYIGDLDECTTDSNKIKNYIDREQNSINLKTVYSYPAIEFWYILHVEKSSQALSSTDSAIKKFKGYLSSYVKPMPRNAKEAEWFLARIEAAIENSNCINSPTRLSFAQQIRPSAPDTLTNPMSEWGILISNLLGL